MPEFAINRSAPLERRLAALEEYLALLGDLTPSTTGEVGRSAPAVSTGGGGSEGGGGGESSAAAAVTIRKAGTDIGTRPNVNLIEGSGISLTVADDSGDDEVDVTITSTAAAGSGLSLLGTWGVDSISADLGAADAEIESGIAAVANIEIGLKLPNVAGTLEHITVTLSGDVGGVGDNVIFTAYKAASGGAYAATALTVTVTGTAGTDQENDASSSVAFTARDRITVYGRKEGSPTAGVRALVALWGKFNN